MLQGVPGEVSPVDHAANKGLHLAGKRVGASPCVRPGAVARTRPYPIAYYPVPPHGRRAANKTYFLVFSLLWVRRLKYNKHE